MVDEVGSFLGQEVEPVMLHLCELVYDHLIETRLLKGSHFVIVFGIWHSVWYYLPDDRFIVNLTTVRDHLVYGWLRCTLSCRKRLLFRFRTTLLDSCRLYLFDAFGSRIAC